MLLMIYFFNTINLRIHCVECNKLFFGIQVIYKIELIDYECIANYT